MRFDIQAVAFDLDGTLYPAYRLNTRLVPFILRHWRLLWAFGKARDIIRDEQEAGRALSPDLFYAEQAALTAKILRAEPGVIRQKIDTLIYRGWEPLFKKIKLYPGVREVLEAFRQAGLKRGMLSDFPLETKLAYLGLDGCWDAVLSSESTGALKPARLPFDELARVLGTPPEKILYVGNSFRCDIIGAKRAGMRAALIKRALFGSPHLGVSAKSRFKPDFVFKDYRQLSKYMLS